jgi:indole-3-glycerol phosphate synthase
MGNTSNAGALKTNTILDEIVAHKRVEVVERQKRIPLSQMRQNAVVLSSPCFEEALRTPNRIHLILEIKPSSPSAGVLKSDIDLKGILEAYNIYASGISVLTDEKYFNGSLERLTQVTQQSPHPVLCKDFIIDLYQIYEARVAGASAVLLIVKILTDSELKTFYDLTRQLGMTPVVEIQNEDELNRALAVNADVLLINNRNLSTFEISLNTTHELANLLRQKFSETAFQQKIIISASGMEQRNDIDFLLPSAHCFLIGSALMKLPLSELPQRLAELSR